MSEISTVKLHDLADECAGQGDFLGALRHSAEALRVVPQDHRARLKVGLCFAALQKPDYAVSTLRVVALTQARRGFVLSAIGACRDALGLCPGAPDILSTLGKIHGLIHGLEGRGRARVPPPVPPGMSDEDDPASILKVEDADALLTTSADLAATDPDKESLEVEQAPVPFFSDLSQEAFVSLVERIGYLKVPENHVILKEHDEGNSLFILLQGEVKVEQLERGQLAKLGAGSLFGELALITSKVRSATVTTTQAAELFEICRKNVEEVAASHPEIAQDLVKFARRRLLMNLMATSRIFSPFDDQTRLQILRAFVSRIVEPKQLIIDEGQESTGLYVILEGEVEVSKVDESGDEVVLAYLKQGDVFGEISLIGDRPTTAKVMSAEKSVLLHLEKSKFDSITSTHPEIRSYLEGLTEERLEETEEAMSSEGVILEADDLILL